MNLVKTAFTNPVHTVIYLHYQWDMKNYSGGVCMGADAQLKTSLGAKPQKTMQEEAPPRETLPRETLQEEAPPRETLPRETLQEEAPPRETLPGEALQEDQEETLQGLALREEARQRQSRRRRP